MEFVMEGNIYKFELNVDQVMEHNIRDEIINKIFFQRRHTSYNIFSIELFIYFQERGYE